MVYRMPIFSHTQFYVMNNLLFQLAQPVTLLENETPYKKLLTHGLASLFDVDLLALIIAKGETTKAATEATEQARKIMSEYGNLHSLGRATVRDFTRFGLNESQAKKLVACIEIGRRRQLSDIADRPRISSSRDCFNCMSSVISDLEVEEFWVMTLNRAHEVTGKHRLSIGGTSGTVVDVKLVLKLCLEKGAAAFIAFHNHPSGNLQPSAADIDLTTKLKAAGRLMDLPMLDHLIISERGYYSFADEGQI